MLVRLLVVVLAFAPTPAGGSCGGRGATGRRRAHSRMPCHRMRVATHSDMNGQRARVATTAAVVAGVAAVVAGHVAALVLAHDRALALYDDPGTAVRSQYWLLALMVGFTLLALWLLAQATV